MLAVPLGYTEADAMGGTVWLAHQDNLIKRLEPEDALKVLTQSQVSRIVTALELIEPSAATIYQRPTIERHQRAN